MAILGDNAYMSEIAGESWARKLRWLWPVTTAALVLFISILLVTLPVPEPVIGVMSLFMLAALIWAMAVAINNALDSWDNLFRKEPESSETTG